MSRWIAPRRSWRRRPTPATPASPSPTRPARRSCSGWWLRRSRPTAKRTRCAGCTTSYGARATCRLPCNGGSCSATVWSSTRSTPTRPRAPRPQPPPGAADSASASSPGGLCASGREAAAHLAEQVDRLTDRRVVDQRVLRAEHHVEVAPDDVAHAREDRRDVVGRAEEDL